MEYISEIAAWQSWVLFVGLGVFLGLERWVPFRVSVQGKLLHVATNLTIAGSNALVVTLLVGGVLLVWIDWVNRQGWGLLHHMGFGLTGNIVASVILLDLIFYGVHRANHRFPILWRFHRAHHSDLEVDVTTALRFHVGKVCISTGIKAVIIPVMGIPGIGWLVYEIVAQAVSQFQHGNVRMPNPVDMRVRRVLVTPRMHWVHHSRRSVDHNTNYGTIFSAWDRWLGTYRMQARREEIQVGLDEYPLPERGNLLQFFAIPFGAGCRSGPQGSGE